MHSTNLLLEEPIRMVSILEPSKPNFFPAMTKIVGTLGPKSRSVEAISACLKAGMSVARFDFSWGDAAYHQETLENLKLAIKATKKLCAVMLDTVGPELQVVNKSEVTISLEENESVVLTPHQGQEASSKLLPINFSGLAKALKPGDTIFVGQYLFTGSETTSVWLEVSEVQGDDVVCVIKNSATLAGSLFTLHCSQIHIHCLFILALSELHRVFILALSDILQFVAGKLDIYTQCTNRQKKRFCSIISSSTPQRVVRAYAKQENGGRGCI